MPDRIFTDARLVELYDPFDSDRGDLDHYVALCSELGAGSVLDIGCGTGTFACRLALAGLDVTGVDPAEASLAIARRKPGAERVRWLYGDPTTLPPDLSVDLAVMTGNVAQVFLTDEDWSASLSGIRMALSPGGRLAFEVRDPAKEAWRSWNREQTFRELHVDGIGQVQGWVELLAVDGQLVSFRHTYRFGSGETLTSESVLRFRGPEEISGSLDTARFRVVDVRDAPDRPGLELVYVAERVE